MKISETKLRAMPTEMLRSIISINAMITKPASAKVEREIAESIATIRKELERRSTSAAPKRKRSKR